MSKFLLVQTIIITFIYLFDLFIVQKLKKILTVDPVMMRNFWGTNGPFPRNFSENLLMSLVSIIHAYLHAKNQSLIINLFIILMNKEYWNLIGRELFLAITWELDFSQACSFPRMLMNHKNFHFTQIPDKTNDVIFLKSPKTMFLGHFWLFLVIFARWIFPKKSGSATHN